jgi:hypothetical protein
MKESNNQVIQVQCRYDVVFHYYRKRFEDLFNKLFQNKSKNLTPHVIHIRKPHRQHSTSDVSHFSAFLITHSRAIANSREQARHIIVCLNGKNSEQICIPTRSWPQLLFDSSP